VLVPGRDGEVGEEQSEDEHVVDREALLDQIAREVLGATVRAREQPHAEPEHEAERDPAGAGDGGFPHGHLVGVPVEHEQVEGQGGDDAAGHGEPEGERDVQRRSFRLSRTTDSRRSRSRDGGGPGAGQPGLP
jgi:hypothetical protein